MHIHINTTPDQGAARRSSLFMYIDKLTQTSLYTHARARAHMLSLSVSLAMSRALSQTETHTVEGAARRSATRAPTAGDQ